MLYILSQSTERHGGCTEISSDDQFNVGLVGLLQLASNCIVETEVQHITNYADHQNISLKNKNNNYKGQRKQH